jgi:hypothetical protein
MALSDLAQLDKHVVWGSMTLSCSLHNLNVILAVALRWAASSPAQRHDAL